MPAPHDPVAPAVCNQCSLGAEANTGDRGAHAEIPGSSLELPAAWIGEDGFNSLPQLLQAVLAQHTSIVNTLRVENQQLRDMLASSGAGRAEVTDIGRSGLRAAGDDTSWEVRATGWPGGGDRRPVKQPMVHADDCLLDTEDVIEENIPRLQSGCLSEFNGSCASDQTIASRPSVRSTATTKSKSSVNAILKFGVPDGRVGNVEGFVIGPFDKFGSLAIVLNVVFIFVQLQYHGLRRGAQLGAEIGEQWPDVSLAFSITETVFNLFFGVELAVRIAVLRSKFFIRERSVEILSFFDTFLVVASSIDLYLFFSGSSSSGMNLNVLRPFRFLRLLRTLRILRSVRVFSKLNVLVNTVAASIMALFWSIVLLGIVMLMGALFLCQSLSGSLEDEAIKLDTRLWIFRMYGTSTRAFYTVFELTFSGGWPNYARTLVEEVSSAYAAFFFAFIVVVTFAMFRIITALFLRDTLAVASTDAEVAVQEKMKQKERYAAKLLDFFHTADTSKDGFLSLAEFETILMDEGVRTWLSIMEVDVHDTDQLFKILDDGDGLVSPEEFVEGVLRLKGHARSQDVLRVMHCCHKLVNEVALLNLKLSDIERMRSGPKPGECRGGQKGFAD